MKKFIILPLMVFITACATTPFNNWIGKDFDQFVIKYGTPVSQFKMQNGDMAYSFKRPCPYTPGQEEILVVVSGENIIKGATLQTRCPSSSEHQSYNTYTAPSAQNIQAETQAERQRKDAEARYNQLYSEYSKTNAAYKNLTKEYTANVNNFTSNIGKMTAAQRDKQKAEIDAQYKELGSLSSRLKEMNEEMSAVTKEYPDLWRALPQ